MKKLLSLILTGIIAVGMVGCSVEENAEDSSEKQVKQEQKQEVKKEQANQDTENSKKETTKKDNNSNNTSKENNTKKQTDKNIENTKEEENDQICSICGEFVPVSDMTDVDGKVAHNECVGVSKSNGDEDEEDDYYAPIGSCDECGTDLHRYDAEYYDKNGNQICLSCYQKEKSKPDYYCSQCGTGGYDDDGYYTDDNGNRICFECSCANWERKEVDDEMVDEDTYNEYNQ